jgi:dynein heavy chain
MKRIYDYILQWHFQNKQLKRSITSLKEDIIESTIIFYSKVMSEPGLRPTPVKSHYVFNLRDVSKIFQGIAKSVGKSFTDNNDFIKLWAHECLRVF